MDRKELWYEMLTTYLHLMHYENGITLPNMIGAYHIYDPSIDLSSSQCVVRVLEDIIDSQNNMKVLIQRCANIHNYVLSLLDEKHPQLYNLNDKIFIGMYDDNLKEHISSVDDLAECLYSIHYKEIITKKFSVTDGNWNYLSDIEIEYINDIIRSLKQS